MFFFFLKNYLILVIVVFGCVGLFLRVICVDQGQYLVKILYFYVQYRCLFQDRIYFIVLYDRENVSVCEVQDFDIFQFGVGDGIS